MAETTTINVPIRYPATLLAEAGEGPSLLYNNDANNTIWLGDDNAIEAGDTLHTIALPPLTGVNVSGDNNLFGIASGGVVQLKKLPGGTAFSQGSVVISGPVTATISGTVTATLTGTNNVTIAGQVAALDVSAATVLINPSAGFILPGQTTNILNFTTSTAIGAGLVTGIGGTIDVSKYTCIDMLVSTFSNGQNVAGAAITAVLEIYWYDDAGATNLVYQENIAFYLAASSGFATPLRVSTPVHGHYMIFQILNPGSASSIQVTNVQVTGSYRALIYSSARQAVPGSVVINGVTITALSSPPNSVFGGNNNLGMIPNVTPGAALRAYLLPLFSGPVTILFVVTVAAAVNTPTLVDLSFITSGNLAAGTGQAGWIQTLSNTAGTPTGPVNINFPRAPIALVVNAAATTAIQFSAVGQQGY